ncbi:hypothetical protein TWF281_002317 [Arthrobotrys megalospora]
MSTSASQLLKKLTISNAKAKIKRLSQSVSAHGHGITKSDLGVVARVRRRRLQLPPGTTIFDIFPNEIIILIIEHMEDVDRDRFSRCSALCFKLVMSSTAHRTLVLTKDSIDQFRDGGACANLRSCIRSLRFEPAKYWSQSINQLSRGEHINQDFLYWRTYYDTMFTKIRISTEALSLFPNVQELFISYKAPRDCEFNLYAAILRGMIGHPICDTLQRLEIQIEREGNEEEFPINHGSYCWTGPDVVSFRQVCEKLWPENKRFLGSDEKLDNNTINSSIGDLVPKLPALREMRIVAYDLPTPFNDLTGLRFEETAFYYIPLAFTSSNFKKLCVETEICAQHEYSGRKGRLDPGFLYGVFSQITDLRIVQTSFGEGDIGRLINRFPNLRSLDITRISRAAYRHIYPSVEGLENYRKIDKLSDLRYLRLPWPYTDRNKRDLIPAKQVKEYVDRLVKEGSDHLETVEFLETKEYGQKKLPFADTNLEFLVERAGERWELDMSKTTTIRDYSYVYSSHIFT